MVDFLPKSMFLSEIRVKNHHIFSFYRHKITIFVHIK